MFSFSNLLRSLPTVGSVMPVRYRARKGTRERKAKIHQKNKAANLAKARKYIPLLKKKQLGKSSRTIERFFWRVPSDNVYHGMFYQMRRYNLVDAILAHRELHHPSMMNVPDAPLNIRLEIDLATDKKNKFVSKYSQIIGLPHPYDHGEDRTILAFCQSAEMMEEARSAGAMLVGGKDVIKQIERGLIMLPDFQYVLAHPDILTELSAIRGLLRRRYPTLQNGALTLDLIAMIKHYIKGVRYNMTVDPYDEALGVVDMTIGQISDDIKHLEDNFKTLFNDVMTKAPKRNEPTPFITRCLAQTPSSIEKFNIDLSAYSVDKEDDETDSDSDDEEETQKKQRA
ncbi:50S ribosomal protein L1 [Adelges cooleyi]|uniref:50S ribosomal protein L1 n=1 Tax=Adelges cooleyi TaxID=133065 RepID=UPI00217F7ED5|nr:50S ribosomal protein L1 [Adelges cooleyi]